MILSARVNWQRQGASEGFCNLRHFIRGFNGVLDICPWFQPLTFESDFRRRVNFCHLLQRCSKLGRKTIAFPAKVM